MSENKLIPCTNTKSKDWYSWINLMPPKPDDFHVLGEVLVPNPGVIPMLFPREPQGLNPNILLMDVYLYQKPGIWAQVMVWKQVRYDKMVNANYTHVEIFCGNTRIANVKVDRVH